MKTSNPYTISQYAKVPLKFSEYYKYVFTFKGQALNGDTVWVKYGGNAGDIYRDHITLDSIEYLGTEPEEEWLDWGIES
jgi:hypothetical protein